MDLAAVKTSLQCPFVPLLWIALELDRRLIGSIESIASFRRRVRPCDKRDQRTLCQFRDNPPARLR
jgi:hypothetical protein